MSEGSGYPDFEPPRFDPPHGGDQSQFGTPNADQGSHASPTVSGRQDLQIGRGRRGLVVAVAVIGLVLVLLVAADRVTPRLIGDRLAATLQVALDTDERPSVRIHGFPFLTQVATRNYQRITVVARDARLGGANSPLSITELDGTLTGVRPNASYSRLSISRFTGAATISFATLDDLTGADIGYDSRRGDGFLVLKLNGAATMSGKPAIDPQTGELYLSQPLFRLGGREMSPVPSDLTDKLFRVRLPALPGNLGLTGVRAARSGLVASFAGRNITLG